MESVCGIDCGQCPLKDTCGGCVETDGKPFGGAGQCPLVACCQGKGQERCGQCGSCGLKDRLIDEFNALGIADMPKVTDLNTLQGAFINLEYTLPGGQTVRFWEDDKVYLGNQLEKIGSKRCYGLAADESHLLVCEYGEDGSDAEIILFKKRSVV